MSGGTSKIIYNKHIARIYPHNDSAELHSVHTKNCRNLHKIVLF